MPNIWFIAANQGVPWGASEFLWAGAADNLVRRDGVAVTASVKEWSAELAPVLRLRSAGCSVAVRPKHEDERAFGRAEVPAAASEHLLRQAPDLVVVSHGDNREGFPWMEFCARHDLPFVSLAHQATEWDWPDDMLAPRLRAAYRSARGAHFVSQHNLRLTEQMLCTDLAASAVVRNPYNVGYDRAMLWPPQAEPFRMACVARLDLRSKAHDVLFNVLSRRKWRERALLVTVVGREGPHAGALRELASLLRLEQVTFLDAVEDIHTVWEQNHALVLPSRREGLPVAVVEAMLCGRPCLVTDVGGSAELIRPDRSGWIAASPTTDALDTALEAAWESRGRWSEMGEAAAQDVRSAVPPDPARAYADLVLRCLGA